MRATHLKGKVILVFGVLILTWIYLYNRSSTESNKTENLSRDRTRGKTISITDRKTRNFSSIFFENHQENSSSTHQKIGNFISPRYKMVNTTSAQREIADSTSLKKPANSTSLKKPANSTSLKKPANSTSLKKPANSTSLKKPANSTSLQKPLNTTSKHTHQNLTVPQNKELPSAKPRPSILVDSTARITKQNIHQKENNSILQNQFDLKKCSYTNNVHYSDRIGQYHRSPSETKFKFYIYNLPSKFNTDIVNCFDSEKPKCFFLDHCGMGPEFTDNNAGTVTRDTHMFAAEVILHNILRFSPHRTLDPDQADMFYIPAYIGLQCLCTKRRQTVSDLLDDLYGYLKRQIYFSTVPHFTTVGKISREMAGKKCPYLNHRDSVNITFLGIELELNKRLGEVLGFSDRKFIQIPYPSYVHFVLDQQGSKTQQTRDVFILLAAGSRVNPYRAKIMNQFHIKTSRSYYDFKSSQHHLPSRKHPGAHNSTMVLFQTDTCSKRLRQSTIPWMEHSVFCLQPPGDSPTRKSFFDSILSGCIPVLFPYPPFLNNPYPFQSVLNYTKFMVTIRHEHIAIRNESVLLILKELSPLTIQNLQLNLAKVAGWLQYSLPNGQIQPHNDAIKLIIQELREIVSPDNT